MTSDQTFAPVSPDDAVAPSHVVAVATGRILHDLAGLCAVKGESVAQVEAMAMLGGAAAFLRPRLGDDGIERVVALIRAGAERVEARDAVEVAIGRKRATRAAERGAKR